MKQTLIALAVSSLLATTAMATDVVKVDGDLPVYKQVGGVSGSINSIGSDTLNNLMALWSEGFKAMYPNVNIQIEGKGSSTAPPALIEGTAQLGPMSRPMKSKELDAFEKKFGYKPTAVKVSIDALAVFIHKDNPIKGMSLKQVDAVFSSTLKRGGKPVSTWGDLGLTDSWKNQPISAYGRNSASGTYGFFKSTVLQKGDYKPTIKEQPGSSAVVQGIAKELGGIGYSGIGYKTSGVRTLALSESGTDYKEPSYENCLTGDYPVARFLYVYVNKKPNQPLDKLTYEFLRFVLAKQGQEIVVKDGYYPLPNVVAAETLKELK
jgi:phosphate transport system substrate-binding protein